LQRLVQGGLYEACSARCGEAGACGADVFAVAVEIAKAADEVEQSGGVLLRELIVEGVLVERLGEELSDVAARVVDDLALLDGLAAVEYLGLH
jgi:hypothetical protein